MLARPRAPLRVNNQILVLELWSVKEKIELVVGVPLSTQDRVPSGVSVSLASCYRKEGSTSVASDTIGSGHKVLEGIPFFWWGRGEVFASGPNQCPGAEALSKCFLTWSIWQFISVRWLNS